MSVVRDFHGLGSTGPSTGGTGGTSASSSGWWGKVVGVVMQIDWGAVAGSLGNIGFGGGKKFPPAAALPLVTSWYRRYLLREPDVQGATHWVAQVIADGPEWAFRNFSTSNEFAGKASDRDDAGNGDFLGLETLMTPGEAVVLTWFRRYLHREPDIYGFYHWVGELAQDGLDKALGNFANSPESITAGVAAAIAQDRAASSATRNGVGSKPDGSTIRAGLGNVSPVVLAVAALALAGAIMSSRKRG